MRYIKEFSEPPEWEVYRQKIKDSGKYKDVHDMADCFQEVFDKFNIPQIENPNEDTWDVETPFWCIPKNKKSDPSNIYIMNLNRDEIGRQAPSWWSGKFLQKVFDELVKIKGMSEKRLGFVIEVSYFGTGILISPKYGFHTKLKEANTFSSNDKFEDLTEYLQEFFDKYRVIYDKTGEENKKFIGAIGDKNSWDVGIKEVENPHTRLTRRKPYILLMIFDGVLDNNWRKRYRDFIEDLTQVLAKIEKRIGQSIKFNPSTGMDTGIGTQYIIKIEL